MSTARTGDGGRKSGPVSGIGHVRSRATEAQDSTEISLADRVNDELLTLHSQRLNDLGLEASGLYPHYQRLINQKMLVGRRERNIVELIASSLPKYDSYSILRGGIGELALLVAATGRTASTYEPHPGRRAAIEAGIVHLEKVGLLRAGALSVVETDEPEFPSKGRTLGVGLDTIFIFDGDERAATAIMRRMRSLNALLIDLRSFLRLREGPAEQDAAAGDLVSMGFKIRQDFPREALTWFRRGNTRDRL